MTKQNWIKHIAVTHNIPVPSKDTYSFVYLKDLERWKAAIAACKAADCAQCYHALKEARSYENNTKTDFRFGK